MSQNGGILSVAKGYVRGYSYATLWYISILLGFYFLYAPLLPLLLINRRWFRKCTDTLYATWEAFNVSLLELVFGVELVLTGDQVVPQENALLVLNHPTRTDWNFLWQGLHHAAPSHNAKIVLKQELRNIPGMGWCMSMSRFIYLARNWASDSARLDKMLDYFNRTSAEGGKQIVLFPEGTNLTPKAKEKSDSFAEGSHRPKYNHVLHPRTTGFVHMARGLMDRGMLGSVLDCTIAYPDSANVPTSEAAVLSGALPSQVHLHITRHPVASLPSTYVGLEKWLEERWREKEARLEGFHCDRVSFPASHSTQLQPRSHTLLQPLCLVASLLFLRWAISLLLSSLLAWLYIALVTITILLLEHKAGGLQEVEMWLEERANSAPPASSPSTEGEDFEHLKPE